MVSFPFVLFDKEFNENVHETFCWSFLIVNFTRESLVKKNLFKLQNFASVSGFTTFIWMLFCLKVPFFGSSILTQAAIRRATNALLAWISKSLALLTEVVSFWCCYQFGNTKKNSFNLIVPFIDENKPCWP